MASCLVKHRDFTLPLAYLDSLSLQLFNVLRIRNFAGRVARGSCRTFEF